ncbi:MAG: hypothetical protein JWO38_3114 [Gemmataceae bacterium]|nr:hypothetical protein [Gemmataceae bacterium]
MIARSVLEAKLAKSRQREQVEEQIEKLKALDVLRVIDVPQQLTADTLEAELETLRRAELNKVRAFRKVSAIMRGRYKQALADIRAFRRVRAALPPKAEAVAVVPDRAAFLPYPAGGDQPPGPLPYYAAVGVPTASVADLEQWEPVEPVRTQLIQIEIGQGLHDSLSEFFARPVVLILIAAGIIKVFDELGPLVLPPILDAGRWCVDQLHAATIGFGLVALGFVFYAFRSYFRLGYGVFEFLFGAVAAFWARPNMDDLGYPFVWLPTLTGVYVMVRGLDNIGKALKKKDRAHRWARLFGRNFD